MDSYPRPRHEQEPRLALRTGVHLGKTQGKGHPAKKGAQCDSLESLRIEPADPDRLKQLTPRVVLLRTEAQDTNAAYVNLGFGVKGCKTGSLPAWQENFVIRKCPPPR